LGKKPPASTLHVIQVAVEEELNELKDADKTSNMDMRS
jgi:hypothetical protein